MHHLLPQQPIANTRGAGDHIEIGGKRGEKVERPAGRYNRAILGVGGRHHDTAGRLGTGRRGRPPATHSARAPRAAPDCAALSERGTPGTLAATDGPRQRGVPTARRCAPDELAGSHAFFRDERAADAARAGRFRALAAVSETRRRRYQGVARRGARSLDRTRSGSRGARRGAHHAVGNRREEGARDRDALLRRPDR